MIKNKKQKNQGFFSDTFFKKNHKAALQMSFGWIFAIIAGGFILFLAIFAITKLTGIENTSQDAEAAKTIGVILNPLETGFESGRTSYFTTSAETRIYPNCNNKSGYGSQRIKVSQKIYGKWTETDIESDIVNKYIFSENVVEGKKFYLFSKPFNFPFKVSDLIYMTSANDNYCFINAPEHIEEEIMQLNQANLFYKPEDCPEERINICFGPPFNSLCDIRVYYENKKIQKNRGTISFSDDSLMYAGIFSDEYTYECQLDRLMTKTQKLSELYENKINLLTLKTGCTSSMKSDLINFQSSARNFYNSDSLMQLAFLSEQIQEKNENEECRLW